MNICIIGNGVVGNAIAQTYCKENKVFVVDKHYSGHLTPEGLLEEFEGSSEELLPICAIGFICLPYQDSNDAPLLLSAIDKLKKHCEYVVIKSTVDFEFLHLLDTEDEKVLLMPEFLTADNAKQDYAAQSHFVCSTTSKTFFTYFSCLHGNNPTFTEVYRPQAVSIKLFRNCFLAAKVSMFNQFFEITLSSTEGFAREKREDIWNVIREEVCRDPRVGDSHSFVPGPDGKTGFGGSCFPKDLKLLIELGKNEGADTSLLKAVENFNNSIRDL